MYYKCTMLNIFFFFQNKYKEQYEKMKHRYTAIADTPHLIRSKKAYLQSSDVSMTMMTNLLPFSNIFVRNIMCSDLE